MNKKTAVIGLNTAVQIKNICKKVAFATVIKSKVCYTKKAPNK